MGWDRRERLRPGAQALPRSTGWRGGRSGETLKTQGSTEGSTGAHGLAYTALGLGALVVERRRERMRGTAVSLRLR